MRTSVNDGTELDSSGVESEGRLALPGTERNTDNYRCHLLRASYVSGILLSLRHTGMHVLLTKALSRYPTPFHR